MTDQDLIDRSALRSCTARRIDRFDREDVIRRLFAGDGVEGDFRLADRVARPSAESCFDVATDGESLYVSVLYWEAGEYFGTGVQNPNDVGAGNHCVEVIFCPCGDPVGHLQFGAGPGDDTWFNHYWPYLDDRPDLGARPQWETDFLFEDLHADLAWMVFFRFPLAAIRLPGYDGPVGFNVMRTQLRHNESATWNSAQGSGFPDGTSCGRLYLEPAPVPAPPAIHRSANRAELCVTYDWPDEMVGGPYSPDTIRRELRFLKEHGVTRVYFLDYPGREHAFISSHRKRLPQVAEHYRITMEAFGGDIMTGICRIARQEGLPFITICKPYDLGTPDPFAAAHPNLAFRRNPAWTRERGAEPVTLLQLFADNDAPLPFAAAAIEVWASDDNVAYTRLEGIRATDDVVERPRYRLTPAGKVPAGGTERVRRIVLSDLNLTARYLAVAFPKADAPGCFGNQEFLLAETSLPVELARFPRTGDFREHGFAYDTDTHASAWSNQAEFIVKRRALPAGGAVGLRLGHDPHMPGMLDPGHPDVRRFWIETWIDRAIAAGCDGVDIRVAHHHFCLDWPAYAYAEPALAAFRERFGRDPEATAEDTAAIQAIRGDFHTDFLREASSRLHAAGKVLEAHIEARMATPPNCASYTGIRWDWPTWIEEGLIDGVNLKYLGPFNPFVRNEVLPAARRQGIPVRCIAAIGDPRSQPRTPEWTAEHLRMCDVAGIAGLNLYEIWVYLRTTPRGEWFPRGCSRAIFAALREEIERQGA